MQQRMQLSCLTLMVPPTTSPVSAASALCSSSPPKHGLKPGSCKHGTRGQADLSHLHAHAPVRQLSVHTHLRFDFAGHATRRQPEQLLVQHVWQAAKGGEQTRVG